MTKLAFLKMLWYMQDLNNDHLNIRHIQIVSIKVYVCLS